MKYLIIPQPSLIKKKRKKQQCGYRRTFPQEWEHYKNLPTNITNCGKTEGFMHLSL